jgi:hypothetical protein
MESKNRFPQVGQNKMPNWTKTLLAKRTRQLKSANVDAVRRSFELTLA